MAVTSYVMLNISFINGLKYALIQMDSTDAVARIVEIRKTQEDVRAPYIGVVQFEDEKGDIHAGEKIFRDRELNVDNAIGLPVEVIYNPDYPEYFMFPDRLEDFGIDYYVSLTLMFLIGFSLLGIVFSVTKYLKFRKKMKYY